MSEALSCQEFVELVTEYLEDALDPAARERFEEHVALCAGCATYLDQIRETARLVGHVHEDHLSEEARTTLLEAFRGWRPAPPSGG